MTTLTSRQRQILDFMREHATIRYPSRREIARALGLSPTTVQQHLDALKQKHAIPDTAQLDGIAEESNPEYKQD